MIDKKYSVCFSGYRMHKLPNTEHLPKIQGKLADTIKECVDKGFHTFFVGMADGFDMMAAEEVVKIKSAHDNITFIAVIPCHNWRKFSEFETAIFSKADQVVAVAERAGTKSYHKRNRYMVDNASMLICYYSGTPGGTKYTVNYAGMNGLGIVNIYDEVSKSLDCIKKITKHPLGIDFATP